MTFKDILTKLNLLDSEKNISITNIVVFLFVAITAFKMLLSGAEIDVSIIKWKVEGTDISSTLPLLFSLLNYAHKRSEMNKVVDNSQPK